MLWLGESGWHGLLHLHAGGESTSYHHGLSLNERIVDSRRLLLLEERHCVANEGISVFNWYWRTKLHTHSYCHLALLAAQAQSMRRNQQVLGLS